MDSYQLELNLAGVNFDKILEKSEVSRFEIYPLFCQWSLFIVSSPIQATFSFSACPGGPRY